MSYILEALKKSEQERGAGVSPTVQTIHSSSLQYQRRETSVWPKILVAMLVINVVALGWFFMDDSEHVGGDLIAQQHAVETEQIEHRATAPTVAQPAASESTSQVVTAVAKAAPKPSPPPAPIVTPVSQRPATTESFTISSVYDLPTDVQASIPDLTFTAHVYSSNPLQRSVVINGNFMEEGDMLTARLKLDEITNDGVVFDYEGMRFHSSVVNGWRVN